MRDARIHVVKDPYGEKALDIGGRISDQNDIGVRIRLCELLDGIEIRLNTDYLENKAELDALAGEINSGAKTFEQAVTAYNKVHSNANVTGKSNTVIVGNTFSEAIAKEITDCTEGKAIVASTDYYMYFISKNRIADASEEYLKTNLDSLRHEMKDTDFSDYVQKVLEGLSISVNSAAVNKYTPKWVENKTK